MLRPQFQQKTRLALLMLASALMIIAEPVYARKTNRAERAASSARQEAKQAAPAPAPAPRAPAATPAPRSFVAGPRRVQQPSQIVQQPSQPSTRSITNRPSINNTQPSMPTQNRVITNNPSMSIQNRNVITNQQPAQTQIRSNNFITNNPGISSRSNTIRQPGGVPYITNQSTISSEHENSLGFNIGSQNSNSSSNNSFRSNSIFNRQTNTSITNQSVTRNNSISNRNSVVVIPSNRASQRAESSNNSISSNLSSRIGGRIDDRSNNSRTQREQNSISTNRNESIFDSVQNRHNVTPPSNSAKQPAGSFDSTSSLDRANTNIGIMIGPERTPPNNSRQPAASLNNRENRNRTNTDNRIGQQGNARSRTQRQNSVGNTERQNTNTSGLIGNTRTTHINPDNQKAVTSETRTNNLTSGRRNLRAHRYEPVQSPQVVYRDRPYNRDSHNNAYLFEDRSNNLYRRYITPRYSFSVRYNRGSWLTFGYVFPYYQRKYLFVSLDGYWPYNYSYMRYYWYGYHPYYWYGYYPMAREIGSNINYYTYNYYYNDNAVADSQNPDYQYYGSITRQAPAQPSEPTLADTYFEEAVDAFEKGNYDTSIEKFSNAMALAPDDMVLPFAYSQALFAAGRYSDAAQVLRAALEKTKPDQDGVFYPRGLYPNEDILLSQIDTLANEADTYSFDADLQLLLGYQLLGLNDIDKAVVPLKKASLDLKNQQAADILLNLLSKIKTNDIESQVPEVPQQEEPNIIEPEQETTPAPVTPVPEKVEPNKALLNQPDTTNLNVGRIAFMDTYTHKPQIAIETSKTENKNVNKTLAATKQITGNEKTNQKAKEGILIAALFVLAGTTGLGHFIHH